MKKTVLLVEDNDKVQKYNTYQLEAEGFIPVSALTLAQAREFLANSRADVIVLDRGMPDGEGLDFLREIRQAGDKTPVLMLTGYGADDEIEQGFDVGCDDYLSKPYTFGVLHKRLLRLLKSAEEVPERIIKGALVLDPISGVAKLNGEDLQLTQKESALLLLFVQHENKTMNKEYLYEKVWNLPFGETDKTLKTHLSRLRKRLENSGYIVEAVRNEGYCFRKVEIS